MDPRPISYTEPVSRCFQSVKRILFKPFDAGKWFALGFSAWLAALLSNGASFQGNFSGSSDDDGTGQEFGEMIESTTGWLQEHMALVITVVGLVVVICLALYLLMLWASSRGKFMFLDNLAHDRALVKAPWKEFKALGNSLFWWRLIFGIIVTLLMLPILGGALYFAYVLTRDSAWSATGVLAMVGAGGLVLLLALVAGYITIMLEDFVIPVMYRERLSTNAAWARFLVLHRSNFWKFVLYFLWSALLRIAASTALAAIGFMTCCIGFIIMAIPYIGAVVTLPISTFFRLLGPEFLRQFGKDYDIFPAPPAPPASPEGA